MPSISILKANSPIIEKFKNKLVTTNKNIRAISITVAITTTIPPSLGLLLSSWIDSFLQ